MKIKYHFLFATLFIFGKAFAQLPEQDCIYAIPVCQSSYFQGNSYVSDGPATELFYPGNTSCLIGGEENSVWYIFTVTGAGDLNMQIAPNSPGDDYDWAIYNLTNSDCAGIGTGASPEVRCNYSAIPGSTGMAPPYLLTSVNAGGPNQCAPLPVLVGETYTLLINNHANTLLGYTLNFSGTAVIYDTVPPTPIGIDPFTCKSPDTLHLYLSEPIRCSSLAADGSDFYIQGPSTPAVIKAYSAACNLGNFFTDCYIVLATPITVNGNYNLRFKIDNPNGDILLDNCGNELRFQDTVPFIVALAEAKFDWLFYNTCHGDSISLIDLSTGDTIDVWQWDFGDGSTSTVPSPGHLYPGTGSYEVTFFISDTSGCISKDSVLIGTYVEPPVSSFTVSAGPYCSGIPIDFFDTSTGQGVAVEWNFAGSGTSNLSNPQFTFPTGGTYEICLYTTDSIGCSDTSCITITVTQGLVADFTVSPKTLCVGQEVEVSDASLGNPTTYIWTGDGINGITATTFTITYTTAGTYQINLFISSPSCFPDSATKFITVYDYPVINLGPDTDICIDETIQLDAGNPDYYHLWSTGETTRFITVSLVPQEISVLVDNFGCSATDTIDIGSACPFFVPNAFTPNGDGVNDYFYVITDGNQEFVFSIYNRWGQKVFATTDPEIGWDGTFEAAPEEMGVFVYELKTIFTNGTVRIRNGNITLIR